MLIVPASCAGSELEKLDKNDRRYVEIRAAIDPMIDGLRNKERGTIAEFSLPEARPWVTEQLQRTHSTLSRFLFEGNQSLAAIIRTATPLEVSMYAVSGLTELGSGTHVCFARKTTAGGGALRTAAELQKWQQKVGAKCLFFYEADQHWYTSWEFLLDEKG
jgi:hypothetical protein